MQYQLDYRYLLHQQDEHYTRLGVFNYTLCAQFVNSLTFSMQLTDEITCPAHCCKIHVIVGAGNFGKAIT